MFIKLTIVLNVVSLNYISSSVISQTPVYQLANFPHSSVSSIEYYGSGLALGFNNNLVLFHRGDRMLNPVNGTIPIPTETVYVIDRESGHIIQIWGKNMFYHPHGITIDKKGNLFLTDSIMHQVLKYNYNPAIGTWDTTPSLELGEKFKSGNDHSHFCRPAAVAVTEKTGDIFVADGYCNSRIVKFDQHGNYLTEWGAGGSPNIPFNISHGLALGEEKDEIIFLADRDNGRVQGFSTVNGKFLYELNYRNFGDDQNMLLNVAHSSYGGGFGKLYAINGAMPYGEPRVFLISFNKTGAEIDSAFHISSRTPDIVRNQVPHDIIVTRDGKEMYIVEGMNKLMIWKFTLKDSTSGSFSQMINSNMLFYLLLLLLALNYRDPNKY